MSVYTCTYTSVYLHRQVSYAILVQVINCRVVRHALFSAELGLSLSFCHSKSLLLTLAIISQGIIFCFLLFFFLSHVSSFPKSTVTCGPERRMFDPKLVKNSVSCHLLKPTVGSLYHRLRGDCSCLVDHTLDLSTGRLRCNRFLKLQYSYTYKNNFKVISVFLRCKSYQTPSEVHN